LFYIYAFLNQHVMFPTHEKGSTLDLILTNENLVSHIECLADANLSDHFPLFITTTIVPNKNPPSHEIIFDYTRADFDKMRFTLSRVNWLDELSFLGTEFIPWKSEKTVI
jgi:hypothetical protein